VSTILEALRERDQGELSVAHVPRHGWQRWHWSMAAALGLVAVAAGLGLVRKQRPAPEPQPAAHAARRSDPAVPVRQSAGIESPVRTNDVDAPPRARVGRWKPMERPAPAVAAEPRDTVPAPPPAQTPGTSTVRVRSIGYSAAEGKRTVTLAVDGGSAVTLHQGESAGGVEVQLILPEAVYVRRGADVFALGVVR
jgi:hypothetical protein